MTVEVVTRGKLGRIRREMRAAVGEPVGKQLRVSSPLLGEGEIVGNLADMDFSPFGRSFGYTLSLSTGSIQQMRNAVRVGDEIEIKHSDGRYRVVHRAFNNGTLRTETTMKTME
jgi:hypothetical protein